MKYYIIASTLFILISCSGSDNDDATQPTIEKLFSELSSNDNNNDTQSTDSQNTDSQNNDSQSSDSQSNESENNQSEQDI